MKALKIFLVAGGSFLFCSAAIAQSFTYEIVWQPVDFVGGMTGPDGEPTGGAGIVSGAYTTKYSDGSVQKGAVRCIGQDQPDGGLFDLHFSCTAKGDAEPASIVYGCNYLGKPGPKTPLGCVGGIQAKDKDGKLQNGALTMEWYTDANARGTGQWYTAGK